MKSDWRIYKFGDLFDTASGLSKSREEFGFGSPFVSFKDVFWNYFLPDKLENLANTSEKEQAICSVKKGDIFLTRTSETPHELGMSSVALQDYPNATFNGFTKRLRLKDSVNVKLDPVYLGYYLRSNLFRQSIYAHSSMTTRASLNNSAIGSLDLVLPPYVEQISIGKKLKALDDKIANNNRINQTLEEMAQALFKSWFVDFEPVKAKRTAIEKGDDPQLAAMEVISGKTAQATNNFEGKEYNELRVNADLFPDKLVESDADSYRQGLIPEGWEASALSEVITIMGGGTPKRSNPDFWDGHILWFSVKDIPKDSDVFIIDTQEKITELGLQKSSTRVLDEGATIITARGTVGKLGIVAFPMAFNQSCYGIKGANGVGDYFTFYNMRNSISELQQKTHGAVFDTITRETFKSILCVLPDNQLLIKFEEKMSAILAPIKNNLLQNHELSQLRNTLLPKLLSGKIALKTE